MLDFRCFWHAFPGSGAGMLIPGRVARWGSTTICYPAPSAKTACETAGPELRTDCKAGRARREPVHVAHALFGLRRLSPSPTLARVLAALTPFVAACAGDAAPPHIAMSLRGIPDYDGRTALDHDRAAS